MGRNIQVKFHKGEKKAFTRKLYATFGLTSVALAIFVVWFFANSSTLFDHAWVEDVPIESKDGIYHPKSFKLHNGLTVVVISNHNAPVIRVTTYYKVGGMDDPRGKSGIAHFLEHMMFKGIKGQPAGQYEKAVTEVGGSHNAFTTLDYTCYYAEIAKEHLDMVLGLEAGRMRGLDISEEKVATEKNVILEERRMRVDNNPGAILDEGECAAIYWGHPYGIPIIGWEHEIQALTRDDILQHYNRWYAPNNAILILTGDITVEKAKKLVLKNYSKIKKSENIVHENFQEPTHRGVVQRLRLESPLVANPGISINFEAPGLNSIEGAEHYDALDTLVYILSSGYSSRFYKSVVTEKRLATGVTVSYSGFSRGAAAYSVSAQLTDGAKLEDLENELMRLINEVLQKPITQAELDKAKKELLSGLAYAKDSSFAGVSIVGRALCIGKTLDYIESWPTHLKEITLKQIHDAATYVLNKKPSVIAVLAPQNEIGKTNAK